MIPLRFATALSIILAPALAAPAIAARGDGGKQHRSPQQRPPDAVRSATIAATVEPVRGDFINGGAVYAYSDDAVYRVYAAPERVTDIALQTGEELIAVASGDTVRWIIGDTSSGSGIDKRVHILVKPVAPKLATNLVITTDRRTYHLALTSTGTTSISSLSWRYPHDALLAIKRARVAAEAATPVATGIDVGRLQFGYRISGDHPAWRPLRAFDDGHQTYIEFPPTLGVGEAPPLFLVDGKGATSLVNYRVKGHFYIVDRLFDSAELRLGAKHQQVVRIVHTGQSTRSGS